MPRHRPVNAIDHCALTPADDAARARMGAVSPTAERMPPPRAVDLVCASPDEAFEVRYAGLRPEDFPPLGLCVATLAVLDCSGFEYEFPPLLLDETTVRDLVLQGEIL